MNTNVWINNLMLDEITKRRRDGETIPQCVGRLLREHLSETAPVIDGEARPRYSLRCEK